MRLAIVGFVGSEATCVFNTFKVNPENPSGPAIPSQARREYKGTDDAASAHAFARKVIGLKDGVKSHVLTVAPGLYGIESGDAPEETASKRK